jgi:hypothetical protein
VSLYDIQTAMEAAAQAVVTLPAEQWPGWVAYLLEALDGYTSDTEYQAVLEALGRDISTRLEAGRW